MEPEVSETEFWTELQAIVSKPCDSEDQIDDALRAYLDLATQHKDEYLRSETDFSRCSYKLFTSSIFATHADYVRRQILYGLLQDDDPDTLHFIASFILFDGRQNEVVLQMLNEEGAFARLLELIQAMRRADLDGDAGLHRLLMDLVYEMSRIQRVKIEDLVLVDDDFIRCLFDIIEDLSYDVTDPYHYPVIRVLLVLNEQFMISAHNPVDGRPSGHLTNKVIKILSVYGGMYKTFGENIILLINREAETSLQLLTLKLLYLIFTTPSTYEYFFTNDLHVLVDILIRNLLDLPEEAAALRHTYLRVLYPLLAHTQLRYPPHYKRDGLRGLLSVLVRGQVSYGNDAEHEKILHFEEVDETTRRLVARCATVDWLRNVEQPDAAETQDTPTQETTTTIETVLEEGERHASPVDMGEPLDISHTLSRSSTVASSPGTASPTRTDSYSSYNTPGSRKHSLINRLGMNLEPASASSLSVQAVAAHHEKPGIITPSRKDGVPVAALSDETPIIRPPKVKPEPPKSRRWRGRRMAVDEDEHHSAGTSSDRNTIPEGIEVSPTTVITPSTPPPPQTHSSDRDSGSGSTLTTSGPPRRSVSNPPPALPPPRRSSHNTPSSSHHRPVPAAGTSRHGQAPLPPKARRWGRGKPQHGQSDSVESGASSVSPSKERETAENTTVLAQQELSQSPERSVLSDPFSPKSPTLVISPIEVTADKTDIPADGAGDDHVHLSVEEAVQNVSLQ
ncbi:hypothetical protein DTO006G1_1925 [Penicillium roqueforti]|uniref:SPIN90/Ldb17 leucine-rich domain-containing protein n=1 Tax=Penicillium roqueforti (strain FM164) TaxID=1365484 RepID=W6QKK6_PENRF|nr:uncharacterized protein LCP9604111_7542 [Penicillium roqueforti]CDM36960.1 Domain of unknown function DUF2013 [Penicillium roqueforti FM164]KAF9243623.1 hypothetical protein LCP9604111_7542 [Penicillium roqueforti]KAI1829486.1 hypothetical protein CBS147337_9706 [Penicillium roqueforti]KAI2679420.1 hypothetical protein CBS147355_3902 [Penicillium roqueforti]KAI2684638.1 hypothetical protein LCP963914a_5370 [Penicillium roqueforti]